MRWFRAPTLTEGRARGNAWTGRTLSLRQWKTVELACRRYDTIPATGAQRRDVGIVVLRLAQPAVGLAAEQIDCNNTRAIEAATRTTSRHRKEGLAVRALNGTLSVDRSAVPTALPTTLPTAGSNSCRRMRGCVTWWPWVAIWCPEKCGVSMSDAGRDCDRTSSCAFEARGDHLAVDLNGLQIELGTARSFVYCQEHGKRVFQGWQERELSSCIELQQISDVQHEVLPRHRRLSPRSRRRGDLGP